MHSNSESAKNLENYGQITLFESIGAEAGVPSKVLQDINTVALVNMVDDPYVDMKGLGRSLLERLRGEASRYPNGHGH